MKNFEFLQKLEIKPCKKPGGLQKKSSAAGFESSVTNAAVRFNWSFHSV